MIQVTLSFNTLAEALAALTAANGAAVPAAVSTSTGNAPAAKPAAPASAPAAAAPSPAKTQAAASATPPPAPAPKADPAPAAAAAETPSLAGEAGYKVLQAAVFELARVNKDAAMGIAASMGVKHMKDLAEDRRPEALTAVKAKLAELTAAQNEVA